MSNQSGNTTQGPTCVGIIMDGNRRWAKARELSPVEGHQAGKEALERIAEAARGAGVECLICYAFSTENWKRSEQEVHGLLALLDGALKSGLEDLEARQMRIRIIGDRTAFTTSLQNQMREIEESSRTNTRGTLVLALSYGGRDELVRATQKICAEDGEISEERLAHTLDTHDIPDPDMIIRTGGHKRLSGFLPWQSVYSELFFTDTLWPDFTKEEFDAMLAEFRTRTQNYGV